jgi:hypothetical protein
MNPRQAVVFLLVSLGYFLVLFGAINIFLFAIMAGNGSCSSWSALGGFFAGWEATFLLYVYYLDASPWEIMGGLSVSLWTVS